MGELWRGAEMNHRGHQRAWWWPQGGGGCPLCPSARAIPPAPPAPPCPGMGAVAAPWGQVSLTSGWPGWMAPLPAASRERNKGTKGEGQAPGVPAPSRWDRAGPDPHRSRPFPLCRGVPKGLLCHTVTSETESTRSLAIPLLFFTLGLILPLQGERSSENSYALPKQERCTNLVLLYSQLLDFNLGNDWNNNILTRVN